MSFSAFLFISPADLNSVLAENRNPHEMPSFTIKAAADGSYESEFDEYVNDNIALRGSLMRLAGNIRIFYGYTGEDDGRVIFAKSDIGTGETLDYRLVLYKDRIMEVFESHPDAREKYIKALNKIHSNLPEGTEMYVMLIPTQLEICGGKFADIEDSQKEEIDKIYSELDSEINTVDVYTKLKNASENEDYLYFKTDHHWTPDGAYFGYEAVMDKMGISPMPRNSFERKELGQFYGSLYLKAKDDLNVNQPMDTCFYYDTERPNGFRMKMRAEDGVTVYNEGTSVFRTDKCSYGVFMGGDNPLVEIKNPGKPDGKSVVMIKDSYANALIPFLANDFDTLTAIDPRSFEGNIMDEIKNYDADAFIVVNYVFSPTFNDYCGILLNITGDGE